MILTFDIIKHVDLDKDIKTLGKKFPTPFESLESWLRLFDVKGIQLTPGIDRYSGVFHGHEIYKARLIPLKENCGKSNGYRLIFEIRGCACILLYLSRHGIYKTEQELINIVKSRLETLGDITSALKDSIQLP